MSKKLENVIISAIVIFLIIFGVGIKSCSKSLNQESKDYYARADKRESDFMEDCLKSLPKYECIYRWQTAIKDYNK